MFKKINLLQYPSFYLDNIQYTGIKLYFSPADDTDLISLKTANNNHVKIIRILIIDLPAFYHLPAVV